MNLSYQLPKRAFQWDLARQTERMDWLVKQLPKYAAWGYQEVYIHLEDAVEFPSLPSVSRKNAYSYKAFSELVKTATRCGITVVPIVNLLGHTQYLIKVPELRHLNECLDSKGKPLDVGQLCPLKPETLKIAELLIRDMAPFCTGGKIHVGLDESYHLGKHPLSRMEIDRIGLEAHFVGYVNKLNSICSDYGLKLGMWADMLAILPKAIKQLPTAISAYDWYYYPFGKLPKIEFRNFESYDIAKSLAKEGIEYWGCPMSGPFRFEVMPIFKERLQNCVDWWKRCLATQASGFLVTSWETQRMGAELPQVVDAAAAGLWLDDEEDPKKLFELGCKRVFGKSGSNTARALWSADKYPFSGYTRWMINSDWKNLSDIKSLKQFKAEEVFFYKLSESNSLADVAKLALKLRAYIAKRDAWVRETSLQSNDLQKAYLVSDHATVRSLINTLLVSSSRMQREARQAGVVARKLWARTRYKYEQGPNDVIINNDLAKLKQWVLWLKKAKQNNANIKKPTVFGSVNKLSFTIENKFPALQRILVQQYDEKEKLWKELFGTFLIEFRERAAQKKTALKYELSVSLEENSTGKKPVLRFAARGFGKLFIRSVTLSNGIKTWRLADGVVCVGQDAPSKGFPAFDWTKDKGYLYLK